MADNMTFDLVSPERKLASFPVSQVVIPSISGDMTAKPGHAPTVAGLRPGLVRAFAADGEKAYAVLGGFAEVSPTSVTVLAEEALLRADFNADKLEQRIARAQAAADKLEGGARQAAEARIGDLRNMALVLKD